ncbi:MAG: riboflavin synthase subunit beta [Rhodobacteraceae bacterium CG17_big_fil_post_rev_8_21_14_2_50_63_15]|nr:riboflavin synthase subunit beta [Roseovarius sp.]PIV79757.1 MAG: riboflavin synthase subunit beta [Rhodobacteraceae bacterium CG17_big_fil_post_rev_8_21_14_2_50_63_15]
MRVIGLCRFSYPAIGGFKRMHETLAEREAYLYAPERMDLRFRHFECLTLPSIAAQQHEDFTFLILVGESLPKPYRERLYDLTSNIPQIKIVESPPMKQRTAMQTVIKKELGEDKTHSIQFRLDDDDAVAVNFTRSLRWFVKHTATLRKNWRYMAIEYNRGFSVNLSEHGIMAEEVQSPFWACGLAVLFRPGDPLTVMNFPHHKLHLEMPTLLHPTPRMYLRAKHEDNDSAESYQTGPMRLLNDDERLLFKQQFNVDEDRVKAVFSGSRECGG